jgi:UPF0755 protein
MPDQPESFEEPQEYGFVEPNPGWLKQSWKKWFLVLLALPLGWFLWLASYAFLPGPPPIDISDIEKINVLIPQRARVENVRKALSSAGVIRDDPRFDLLVRLTGAARRLRAGEYIFQAGMTPYKVLQALKEGRVYYRPVTIPEGWELYRITEYLAAEGWINPARFMGLARDRVFIRRFGITASSLEGYLFPDTYYLSRGAQDEVAILTMMVNRFQEVYDNLAKKGNSDHQLTRHEIVTLASIIEKETGKEDERPVVARVFLNRLQKNMPLQADPTVIYGLGKFAGKLTRKDLQTPTPYNTYTRKGLPPGPICNPGQAALAAVFNPASVDYLYFVSRNNGTHQFTETLQQHNQAVLKYQKRNSRQ